MANGQYNNFNHRVYNGDLDFQGAVVLHAVLLRSTGAYTFDPDHDTMSQILATGVEITVASYARVALSTKAVTLDDSNDRTKVSCDNISFGSLESGQTVDQVVIMEFVTDDTDHIPLLYFDGTIDVTACSPVAAPLSGSVSGATAANPVVITATAHGMADGDRVRLTGLGGMTEVNDRIFTVANQATNTFELSGEDGTSHTAYTSSGTWRQAKTVYIEKLLETVPADTALDFGGGATCNLGAEVAAGAYSLEVYDLGAAIDSRDVSSDVVTALAFPAALGGGAFNLNIPTDGLLNIQSK